MSCLPTLSYQSLRVFLHAQADRQADRQDSKNHTQKTPTRAARKKKAGRAGLDLAKDAEHRVRVEGVVLVREEETQGESQTPKQGFGFPQHLRERKTERQTSSTNIPTTRKKEDTNINANKGQVLKGTEPNKKPTPETK